MSHNPPLQCVPVPRTVVPDTSLSRGAVEGVQMSQSSCDGLTGLAQQMCYAVMYGV